MLNKKDLLFVEESHVQRRTLFIMIVVAYLFSVLVRFIWVYQVQDEASFYWNGQLMINTNDGYWFAEGARDILSGHHELHDLSPIHSALSVITAYFAKLLPIKFETLILYMPSIFGSLLVVPVLLIARILKLSHVGFIAALLSGIVWSYYHRTMTGYYDSDMLNIVLPTFVLWSLMFNVTEKRHRFLPLVALFMLLYTWWYPQSYSLHLAMAIVLFLYTLVFERKESFNYKIILIMLISMSMIPLVAKLALMGGLFLLSHYKSELVTLKMILALNIVAFLLLVFSGGISPIITQVQGYIFRSNETGESNYLHYYDIVKTVQEAGKISFETFANRISGNIITFLLSTIGYVMFAIRYPLMWLALPMIGLGFVALKGGLRFTIYAVPINALGIGFFIVWVAGYLKERKHAYIFMALATAGILAPNIKHVTEYTMPTVFSKEEVSVVEKLKTIAKREDYILSWWDYGYPLRYYADVKTLIDGGKHTGDVNFPVSFALSASQVAAVNMARLAVEYTEKAYRENLSGDYLSMMMKDYGFKDPEDFLLSLEDAAFKLPKKSADVYFYLPYKMVGIFPTILKFENLNLKDGTSKTPPFVYYAPRFKETKDMLYLGQEIAMEKKNAVLHIGEHAVQAKRFVTLGYDQKGKLQKNEQLINPNSHLSIIFLQSYNAFLLLDDERYNSSFIQLFIFENYDKDLFEPVILSPFTKVYKIKK